MKYVNPVTALGLLAMLLNPDSVNAAGTNNDAIEACAGAIAAYIEDRQGTEPGLRVDTSQITGRNRLDRFTKFEMDAFDASSRSVVGRFTCVVDGRGKVKRLVTLPLGAPDASERAAG